ncbi:hypothetical protein PFISCL1PPCAC_5756 [Pristionchus fissidentatus]|uniref:Histone acetyltransferase n=1 Tax=Pristionchus fissidentatus TaxID=1538716 RepID=A0AAV5V7J8_9BILA|nr:hypothetical protein PFISCL1PPCAC_5756 [Pristionchus fissidentatus]
MPSTESAKSGWKRKLSFESTERNRDRLRKRVEEEKSKGTDLCNKEEEERKTRANRLSSTPVKPMKTVRSSTGSPSKGKKEATKRESDSGVNTRNRLSVERSAEEGIVSRRGETKARSVSSTKSPQKKQTEEDEKNKEVEEKNRRVSATVVKGHKGRPVGWRKGMSGYLQFIGVKKPDDCSSVQPTKMTNKLTVDKTKKKKKKQDNTRSKVDTKNRGRRKKITKASPMKTRALQKRSEKEENSLLPRCVLCKSKNGEMFPCAECKSLYHLRKCCRYSTETASHIESGLRKRWLCARCTACAHCSEYISDPHNVECSVCAFTYHGKCGDKGGKTIDGKFACHGCVKHLNTMKSLSVGKEEKKDEGKERSVKRGRTAKGWALVARENEGEEERKRIEERDALYDQLMEHVTKGTNSGNINSPSKYGAISSSPQKIKKVALQSDIDLFESAKAALAAENSGKMESVFRSVNPCDLPSTSSAPVEERFQWIYVGSRKDKMKSVYSSPYPQHIVASPNVYICPFCLRANSDVNMFRIHQSECTWNCPPGNEIYRDTERKFSFFEIDGDNQKLYCRRVCMLGKLFISSKTLVDEVETFLFYVLTEHTNDGCEFVGYFSKEKNPSKNNNLSCILTLPSAMRSGYGRLLIDLSYELSRVERKIGSPEHPLSDLGIIAYRGFWRSSILCYLRSLRGTQVASVKQISLATRIAPHDVINQLMRDGLLFYKDGVYFVNTEQRAYRMPLAMTRRKTIDHSKLKWQPNDAGQDNLDSSKLNYYV